MAGRCLRMARRHLDVALTSLLLPVLLMLLFVYLFGGAIQTGTRYVTYVVPGVLQRGGRSSRGGAGPWRAASAMVAESARADPGP